VFIWFYHFNAAQITDADCGYENGSIIVTLTNAAEPVSYAWSGGLPDNDTVTGVHMGTYEVTATDAHGSTATATYDVAILNL